MDLTNQIIMDNLQFASMLGKKYGRIHNNIGGLESVAILALCQEAPDLINQPKEKHKSHIAVAIRRACINFIAADRTLKYSANTYKRHHQSGKIKKKVNLPLMRCAKASLIEECYKIGEIIKGLKLNERELNILLKLLRGYTVKEIAAEMSKSPRWIRMIRQSIGDKYETYCRCS